MKIEELSIGDWVCSKLAKWESDDADTTSPLQVKRIDGIERHNLYVDLFNPTTNTIEHSAFVEDLVPIPLTPEILDNNGFVEILGDFVATHKGFYVNAEAQENRFGLEVSADGHIIIACDVKFVHQLQHAFRLAGIEKEIELK